MATSIVDPVRLVPDEERRARLGVRHALAVPVDSAEAAARAMTVLHATEPISVHLACWARTRGVTLEDVDAALYADRCLVKQLSMRRTLFALPRDLLPSVWGSACARIAPAQRTRLVRDLETSGVAGPGAGERWLEEAQDAVLELLADGVGRTVTQLREAIPELTGILDLSPGTKWGQRVHAAPRVVTQLHLEVRLARADLDGNRATGRQRWTTPVAWLGAPVQPTTPEQGYREIVSRWLWTFGPGTVEDLTWWLGGTKTAVRRALTELDAVPVSLDDGSLGWLRPDDVEPVSAPESWVALLPILDPTVMGWRGRDFYLGPHASALFDSVGNAGTTAWADGRIVGAWVQDKAGRIDLVLVEDVAPAIQARLRGQAAALTEWLGGQKAYALPPSPAMKATSSTP